VVTFKDYYAILGVPREATGTEIKRAYRRKAKQLHPDVDRSAGAEERFRALNEANEVLSDPEKRRRYDQLGSQWKDGAEFQPPPGFEFRGGNLEDLFGSGGGHGAFSEFFESLFGSFGMGAEGPAPGAPRGGRRRAARPQRGADVTAEVQFSLLDLLHSGQRRISVNVPSAGGGIETRTATINLPRGVRPGQRLRLPGLGATPAGGGPAGDLFLQVQLKPELGVQVDRDDLIVEHDVPAPLAALGGVIRPHTPEGPVALRIAGGTQSGTLLRVRGRGLWRREGDRGDLLVRVRIIVPTNITGAVREHYEALLKLSTETTTGGGES
jgi:curved DNA-binding protein